MSLQSITPQKAPSLPLPPKEYNTQYQEQLNNVLRLYFNQIDTTVTALLTQLKTGVDETGYVQLDLDGSAPNAPGKLNWNATDGTANMGYGFGGVVNQIGQELTFPPLYNNTGGFVDEGTVIGITGYSAVGGGLTFVKFLADGSLTSVRALATTTSDMNNTDRGFATRSGYIRALNTTGAQYGETWATSDILYASPTTAGALTNIKPTAPNLIAVLGIVAVVSATEGVMLMLVSTIQFPVQYGVFSDTTDQAVGAANTPQTITFNTTDTSQGVSRGSPTSRIITSQPGIYNFQFSVQLTSSVGASRTISIWPRINGVDVTNSATEITIKSNTDVIVPAWNFVFSMGANDYFELVWASTGNSITLEAVAVQAAPFVRPAIPSVILTVTQVNQ